MSKTISSLSVETQVRSEGQNPRQIRAAGALPITVYGKNIDSKSLQVDAHSFRLQYRNNPDATFELNIDGKKVNAVVQEIQIDYVADKYLNVEFKVV